MGPDIPPFLLVITCGPMALDISALPLLSGDSGRFPSCDRLRMSALTRVLIDRDNAHV